MKFSHLSMFVATVSRYIEAHFWLMIQQPIYSPCGEFAWWPICTESVSMAGTLAERELCECDCCCHWCKSFRQPKSQITTRVSDGELTGVDNNSHWSLTFKLSHGVMWTQVLPKICMSFWPVSFSCFNDKSKWWILAPQWGKIKFQMQHEPWSNWWDHISFLWSNMNPTANWIVFQWNAICFVTSLGHEQNIWRSANVKSSTIRRSESSMQWGEFWCCKSQKATIALSH